MDGHQLPLHDRGTGLPAIDDHENSISVCEKEMGEKFQRLTTEWKTSRGVSSSLTFMKNLPAYQEIIQMGAAVVPLILRELEKQPDWWFAALREITKENPVPPGSAGKLPEMTAAWLKWGRANNVRW